MFQTSVLPVIAAGLIGEAALYDAGARAQPAMLATTAGAGAALNIVGRAFTRVDGGTGQPLLGDNGDNPHVASVQAGGAGAFMGILFHPKAYAQPVLTSADLGPLPNGTLVELSEEHAGLFLEVPAACEVGDFIYFLTADGSLVTAAPDAALPAGANETPIGRVERFDVATAGGGMIVGRIGAVSYPRA